ncbi:MAG TPA: PfkB family carbohydrate kinase, partial [Lachnospiraceae bacterium]|nr:PfkB family carbohydrate kinase [Lachnospiraceae bacterium]
MYDLVSLGELLIDFTPMGISEQGNPCFERNPGGGPANMACAAARFGTKVSLITKVGDDMFGQA